MFAFPIILGIFFHMAFENIEKDEALQVFDIAVIDNKEYQNQTIYQETFKELSDKKNKDQLFRIHFVNKKEAEQLLEDNEIEGYVLFNKQEPQIVIMMPLIEGLDGKNKMSKTLGNYIGIYESAKSKYQKVMEIPDELIVKYYTLLTDVDDEKIKEITSLHPDLIIVSFGTNEAHSRRYLAQAHKMQIGRLLGMLKAACPEAAFLLTTPPGAYVGRRRARTINPRTVTAARIIKEYAQENKMAVWDMYNIVGGKTDACRNWTKHHMLRADGIHFTPDGYRLQGNLLHQALIKAYNEYVATGLE